MDKKTALCRAITLTDEILALLDQGELAAINILETERQPLIQQAFSDSIEEIDLIKAQHLRNLNQQVVDRLTLFKKSVLRQQNQLRNSAKAARAYLSLSPDRQDA